MNGRQNGKTYNLDKPFPGCLGRMVNLFDFSTGVTGNRLLTDRPHFDGSPLSRSRSDLTSMSPIQTEDKVMVSELRRTSSKRTNGTPMKMLIAQEMASKEAESKHNPPSVVAKLMGLDAFPRQEPDSAAPRSHSRVHSRCRSGVSSGYLQQEHRFLDAQMPHEIHQCSDHDEYKDVYEIWQRSTKPTYVRDKSPQKGIPNEATNEKRIAFIRQKFIEAKRLATDEKLRQSSQFQDALEVLCSNKDLFLKFLQEPNSLFSQHLHHLQSVPTPPETKRITILRPSKMVDNNKFSGSENNKQQINKASHMDQLIGLNKSKGNPSFSPSVNWSIDDNPAQPTRIVVLKPSSWKPHDIKAVVSPPSSSPRMLHDKFYEEPEDGEALESREVAKELTWQMHENLSRHRRDETLLSSVFSNGYIGDESSFNKSENEYVAGNLTDSEVMSPTSRHSWDYNTRFGSPYSSSFSHTSFSPESSVCREAKKRLSERWAMMASNGTCHGQRHVRRSSSTLGEMLALSDTKKPVNSEEVSNREQKPRGTISCLTSDLNKDDSVPVNSEEVSNREQKPRGTISCLTSDLNKDDSMDNSPKNLLRSKSIPMSSTTYGDRLNVEVSDPGVSERYVPKEVERSVKSSFKGKVSSLFFSRNKKSSKEKSSASQSKDGDKEYAEISIQSRGKIIDGVSQCVNDNGLEEELSPGPHGSLSRSSSSNLIDTDQNQGFTLEAGLSTTKPMAPGYSSENQDHRSPVSVLEPPFEKDDNMTLASSTNIKADQQGAKLPAHPTKLNLIDKSPPIGSVARTLSWDDSCVAAATPYLLNPSVPHETEEEEGEWFLFVQTLLSEVGLDSEVQSESFLARWHSPESPLDPSLRDKYFQLNNKDTMHEGKRRQQRSTRKLVFDCVNAALVDITGSGSDTIPRAIPCGGFRNMLSEGASPIMVDRVWARMKEWFSSEVRRVFGDGGDSNSLVVERVVREVVGKDWVEPMRLEVDNIGNEIEVKLLEELVQEVVVALTNRV